MEFKKGSRIEVLSMKEVSFGVWRLAEILGGNGGEYTVKYEGHPSNPSPEIEKVPRSVMRPCPPPVFAEKHWPGDIVEVFDNRSWKRAIILKARGQNCFLVRFLGSFAETVVSKVIMRVRQAWGVDGWTVLRRGTFSCRDECGGDTGPQKRPRLMLRLPLKNSVVGADRTQISRVKNQNYELYLNRPSKPYRKRKRQEIESYSEAARKSTAFEKNGGDKKRVLPKGSAAEKYVFVSPKTRTQRFRAQTETDMQADVSCRTFWENPDSNNSESVESSVGSCSPCRDDHCDVCEVSDSDAESFPEPKGIEAAIHRLEVTAYRKILQAFSASAPVAQNRVEVLTRLRKQLNVSEDESFVSQQNMQSCDTRFHRSR